ncbi:MAG: hypothetical protein NTV80_22730 [Verrucomicrobia bacterium]|nr:hypothetical protein [Verrucomicrobiota bacterium]
MPTRRKRIRRQFWTQSRKKVALITLVGLIALGFLLAHPTRVWWQRQRALANLKAGKQEIAQQNWPNAMRCIAEAARRMPDDPEILRAVADVQIGAGDTPQNIRRTLQRLVEAKEATADDRIKLAKACLDAGDILALQLTLSSLPTEMKSTPLAVEVEAEMLMRLDRVPEAESRLRERLAAQPDDADAAFKIAVIDIKNGTVQTQEQARALLWQEVRMNQPQALVAMHLLLQDPALTAEQAAELITQAETKPQPMSDTLRYAALGALLKLKPDERHRILRQETERNDPLPPAEQMAFLRFLAAVQEPDRLLEFLNQHETALSELNVGEAVNLQLEAFAQIKQWQQVRSIIAKVPEGLLDLVTLHLWHACASGALEPNETQARAHLRTAYEATGDARNLSAATRVADTAERLGYTDLAAAYYEALATQAPLPLDQGDFLEKAIQARIKMRDSAALVKLTRKVAKLTPGHAGHAFQADYMALLTQAPIEDISQRLTQSDLKLAQNAEFSAQRRLLWCLIYACRQQGDMLRKELTDLETAMIWPVGQRAVIAGLLAQSGETQRAWAIAEKLPESLLLKEESVMLAKAR